MAKKKSYRYGENFLGYPITNKLTDRFGRKTVVAKRSRDYCVGVGYDEKHKCWAQGFYDFDTREDALKFAKYVSYRRK